MRDLRPWSSSLPRQPSSSVSSLAAGVPDRLEKLQLVRAIEQAAEAIVVTDVAGCIRYVNPAFSAITGYSAEEALGGNPRLLKSGANGREFYERMWSTIVSGRIWRGEIVNRRKDGTSYVEEMTITPVRGEDGRLSSFIAIKQDVTRRNAAENASRFLASIVESTDDAILGGSTSGLIHSWNRGAERLFGYTAGEMIGRKVTRLVPPGLRGELNAILGGLVRGRAARIPEFAVLRKDGSVIEVAFTASPIRDAAGAVTGAAAVVRDITAELAAQRALAQSERRFRSAFEHAPVGICLSLDGYRLRHVNPTFAAMLGYSEAALIALGWKAITFPGDWPASEEAIGRLVRDGPACVEFEKRYLHANGKAVWARVRISLAGESRSRYRFLTYVEDITDLKASRQAVAERAMLSALGAEIGLILTTAATVRQGLQQCAEAFVRHTGAAFARIWTLNDAAAVLELEASAGIYTRIDGTHSRIPVGEYKIGRIALCRQPHLSECLEGDSEIQDPAWAAREALTSFAGYPLLIENRLVGVVAAFKRSPFGEIVIQAFSSVSVQLAQFILRKRAERAISASLREKEALLREIHHRVKNNLQIVCSLLKLNSRLLDSPAQRDVFLDMQNRVKSMALVHEALYRSENLAGIDFSQYCRRLAGQVLRSFGVAPESVDLRLDVESVVLPVDVAIPCALILTELISNSAKYAFPAGQGGVLHLCFRQSAASLWTLSVTDSGPDPEPAAGHAPCGFGLELVRLLAEQLRGTLELRRSPGFSVTVCFPDWEPAPPRAAPSLENAPHENQNPCC